MEKQRYYLALFSLVGGGRAFFSFRADSKELAADHARHCASDTSKTDWPRNMRLRKVSFVGTTEPQNCGELIVQKNSHWAAG